MGFWDLIKQLFRLAVATWWNKVTENYGDRSTEPNPVVEYPEDYTTEYFKNGFTDYRWNPVYRAPTNQLYNNENRFRYKKPEIYG